MLFMFMEQSANCRQNPKYHFHNHLVNLYACFYVCFVFFTLSLLWCCFQVRNSPLGIFSFLALSLDFLCDILGNTHILLWPTITGRLAPRYRVLWNTLWLMMISGNWSEWQRLGHPLRVPVEEPAEHIQSWDCVVLFAELSSGQRSDVERWVGRKKNQPTIQFK